ncbi:MAG: hypothetical protein JRG86_12250 [Deltaproteobacteria bacterium]|jgi:hypothetical protein|nr:hypothetical protein [Deltaproteobacteria bacterium]MBW2500424.1 hypothetical protein [Deltaproteobacteria bacterium]
MAEKLEDFENVSVYTIDSDRRETLLSRGEECAVVWSTRDGWPVGVMHIYFWRDGRFWITCTQQRKRVPALRARPQSSVIVSFEDEQTITAKTLATVHEPGNAHEKWLFAAMAERVLDEQPADVRAEGVDGFVKRLQSDNRVIIELEPVKWITFDGRRVKAHAAGLWTPGEEWVEPDE